MKSGTQRRNLKGGEGEVSSLLTSRKSETPGGSSGVEPPWDDLSRSVSESRCGS